MKNISIIKTLALTILLSCCFVKAAVLNYYVNPIGGNDTRDGKSLSTSLKTIGKAYELVQADVYASNNVVGSTYEASNDYFVNIAGGPWADIGSVTLSDKYKPLVYGTDVVVAFNNHPLVIQSFDTRYQYWACLYTVSSVPALFRVNVSGVVFNRLRFFGSTQANTNAINLEMISSLGGKAAIKNCVFNYEYTDPDYGTVYKISGSAIDAGTFNVGLVKNLFLQNNVFVGPSSRTGTGIIVTDLTGSSLIMTNNTFYRLGTSVLYNTVINSTTKPVPTAEIRNNIFLSCTKNIDLTILTTGSMAFNNCLSYDCGTTAGTGNLINPMAVYKTGVTFTFTDTLRRDPGIIHFDCLKQTIAGLGSNSPCINAGSSSDNVLKTDLLDNTLRGDVPDIGVVEYTGLVEKVVPVKIYVNPEYVGTSTGSSVKPFTTLQAAYDFIPSGLAMQPYIINLVKGTAAAYTKGVLTMDPEKKNFTTENTLTLRSADMSQRVTIKNTGSLINLKYTKNVVLEGINFEGSGVTLNRAIVGSASTLAGYADNAVVRQCKFACNATDRLQPIYGLGNGSLIENCIFWNMLLTEVAYPAIEQGVGGNKYKIYNNTVLTDWYYFIKMATNVNTEVVNNLVIGLTTPAIASVKYGTTVFALEKNNYYYVVNGANQTAQPQIDLTLGAAFCTPLFTDPTPNPLINGGFMMNGLRRDDYYGKFDGEGKRDIGAVEYDGYSIYDQTYFSLDASGKNIAEIDKNGLVKYTNIYGANGIIGKEIYTASSLYLKSLYYLKNHIGSTMKVVDNTGENADSLQYYDFGTAREYAGAAMAGLTAGETFTGKAQDNNGKALSLGIQGKGLGLYYFGARYYDPDLCMWTSPDPDLSDLLLGLNPYAYCRNNPILLIDPDGRMVEPGDKPEKNKKETNQDYSSRVKKWEAEKKLYDSYSKQKEVYDKLKANDLISSKTQEKALEKLEGLSGIRKPVPGARVTSAFSLNRIHPVTGERRPHHGIDFAAPRGTSIQSSAFGIILKVGDNAVGSGYGKSIEILTPGGSTYYNTHMNSIAPGLTVGQVVIAGQSLGTVGSTGISTGPHDHFEYNVNGIPVDPQPRFESE